MIRQVPNLQAHWIRSEMCLADQLTKEAGGEVDDYSHLVRSTLRWTLGEDPRAPASRRGRALLQPEKQQQRRQQQTPSGNGALDVADDEDAPPEVKAIEMPGPDIYLGMGRRRLRGRCAPRQAAGHPRGLRKPIYGLDTPAKEWGSAAERRPLTTSGERSRFSSYQ